MKTVRESHTYTYFTLPSQVYFTQNEKPQTEKIGRFLKDSSILHTMLYPHASSAVTDDMCKSLETR